MDGPSGLTRSRRRSIFATMDERARAGDGRGGGKIILLGEHAVVYGVPALVMSLVDGARAHATPSARAELSIPSLSVAVSRGDDVPLARALDALLTARGGEATYSITVEVALPTGAGLGSSAAIAVAVLRALDDAEGTTRTLDDAQRLALAWETIFHGNPSGIDTAMALESGVKLFRRAITEGPRRQPMHFETITPRSTITLVVADSGEHGSTKEMVAGVARSKAQNETKFQKTLDAIETIVRNGTLALHEGDARAFGQLCDVNQALLASWLVSTEKLEELCRAARDRGALGAKLTGGGGGGSMIAVAPDRESATPIAEALEAAGARKTMIVDIGG